MHFSPRIHVLSFFLLLASLAILYQATIGVAENQERNRGFSYYAGRRCSWTMKGRLMFDAKTKTIVGCDGGKWSYVSHRSSGNVSYSSCYEILQKGASAGDGLYFLSYRGQTYRAFCDMTTEGGGWTLFATKAYCTFGSLFTYKFNMHSGTALSHDSGGCIPSSAKWREVLFRFKGDGGASYTVFNRAEGGRTSAKNRFIDFLTCGGTKRFRDANWGRVPGFYRHTPLNNNGRRTPPYNFASIGALCFGSSKGVAELFSHSDKWIDLWRDHDNSNKYYKVSQSVTQGRKCVAGVCRKNDPVWIMYR